MLENVTKWDKLIPKLNLFEEILRVKRQLYLLLVFLNSITFSAFSQDRAVTGTVTDEKGQALMGVSVKLKGTSTGVSTNDNGNFTVSVSGDKSTLVFSHIGFIPQEIAVNGRNVIKVQLKESNSALGEVVVVGYGKQKKANLTGSVASITGAELNTTRSTDLLNMMTGKLPGLMTAQRSSEPGAFHAVFSIRGFGNGTDADPGVPLIIVDGVPTDSWRTLDPNDIESISMLKDGSAAMYGLNSANGVLLITTKAGKAGVTKFDYTVDYGLIKANERLGETLNAYQVAVLKNEIGFNTNWNASQNEGRITTAPRFSQAQLDAYKDGTLPSTDWGSIGVRTYASQTTHNLSASGGSDKITYLFSGGYQYEGGLWKSGDLNYHKYNFRSNVNAKLTKDLQLDVRLSGIYDMKNEPGNSTGQIQRTAWFQDPTVPLYANNDPSRLGWVADAIHPLAASNKDYSGYREFSRRIYQGVFEFTYTAPFLKGLNATLRYSLDGRLEEDKQFRKQYTMYTYDPVLETYTPTLSRPTSTIYDKTYEYNQSMLRGTLNYSHTFFKNHNISTVLLFEQRSTGGNGFEAQRELKVPVDELFAGTITNQIITSTVDNPLHTRRYAGRLNYDYKGRYLVEGSLTADGSNKFAAAGRWGYFPYVSAGWRISEESFFKKNVSFVNNLKFTASWGELGDDYAARFQWLSGYPYPGTNANSYIFNGVLIPGVAVKDLLNPDITWYTSVIKNFAIEADFFKNKLHAKFEIFRRDRTGLLDRRAVSVPVSLGANLPQENINSDRNDGFELLVSYNNRIGNFNYSVSVNMAVNHSSIIKDDGTDGYNNSFLNWRDNPNKRWRNRYLGRHVVGQFQSFDEIYSSPIQDGAGNRTLLPGDLKYEDWNNDGIINNDDRYMIGRNGNKPDLSGGVIVDLGWKGLSLNLNLQGATSFWVRYFEELEQPIWYDRGGLAAYFDRWHREDPTDPNSKWIPGKYSSTLAATRGDRNHQDSDFWLHDASYLRLRSAELGYTIPKRLLGKSFRSVRIFATGFNLLTFTALEFTDPEKGGGSAGGPDSYGYPITKSYNVGLRAGF